jgi:hypothetical protein
MGNALWVSIDLERGAEILRILDEAGLKVSAALWVHLEEYTDWRLLKGAEGMRLGGQTIGNRWVEDAYVYRVS